MANSRNYYAKNSTILYKTQLINIVHAIDELGQTIFHIFAYVTRIKFV